MSDLNFKETAEFIRNDLRLKTFPIAVKFLNSKDDIPEKTRRPSVLLGKRVTICQAVTLTRVYGWTVGLTREDLICVPAMIAFGFSGAPEPTKSLATLFCQVEFAGDESQALSEAETQVRLENNEYEAIVFAPLQKATWQPDTVALYGNPAQVMRMVQAWTFKKGKRVPGNFGGKVECTQYLVEPFKGK